MKLNRIIYFFVFLFGLNWFSNFAQACKDGIIGEIRYSILTLEQFQEACGKDWVLLAGQPILESTKLYKFWGKEKLPDARGVFLRGMNHGRCTEEGGNPHGDSIEIGTYVQDTFKSHHHAYSLACHHGSGKSGGGNPAVFADYVAKNSNDTGDLETAPKYIATNIFIKINDSNNKKDVKQEIEILTKTQEFHQAVENAVSQILNKKL